MDYWVIDERPTTSEHGDLVMSQEDNHSATVKKEEVMMFTTDVKQGADDFVLLTQEEETQTEKRPHGGKSIPDLLYRRGAKMIKRRGPLVYIERQRIIDGPRMRKRTPTQPPAPTQATKRLRPPKVATAGPMTFEQFKESIDNAMVVLLGTIPSLSEVQELSTRQMAFVESAAGRCCMCAVPVIGDSIDALQTNPMLCNHEPPSVFVARCGPPLANKGQKRVSSAFLYTVTLRARATKLRRMLIINDVDAKEQWAENAWRGFLRSTQWIVNIAAEKHVFHEASVEDPLTHIAVREFVRLGKMRCSFEGAAVANKAVKKFSHDNGLLAHLCPTVGLGKYKGDVAIDPKAKPCVALIEALLWTWCGTRLTVGEENTMVSNEWFSPSVWARL